MVHQYITRKLLASVLGACLLGGGYAGSKMLGGDSVATVGTWVVGEHKDITFTCRGTYRPGKNKGNPMPFILVNNHKYVKNSKPVDFVTVKVDYAGDEKALEGRVIRAKGIVTEYRGEKQLTCMSIVVAQ